MKKILITMVCLFMLSGIGMASPLLDYSKGAVGFDYTYRPSLDMKGSITYDIIGVDIPDSLDIPASGSFSKSFDGSANLDLGMTIGMGNNWAVQYRQYNPQGSFIAYSGPLGDDEYWDVSVAAKAKVRQDEFNLLYKIAPNAAAFVGLVRANAGLTISGTGNYVDGEDHATVGITLPELRSADKNMFQFGLLGSAKLADNLAAYGVVSFASDYRNWEAGLSYDLDPNWQLNVSYRDTTWNKMTLASGYVTSNEDLNGTANIGLDDINAKGWGFGLSYKF